VELNVDGGKGAENRSRIGSIGDGAHGAGKGKERAGGAVWLRQRGWRREGGWGGALEAGTEGFWRKVRGVGKLDRCVGL
jgi:hypothetical protein